mmetsp:Transcript_31608/g.79384  ORF Transcript_31608/g.79384 Transcript_31608/m.79384 type:complete len:99 (-) Transcript_31608:344-640(-)
MHIHGTVLSLVAVYRHGRSRGKKCISDSLLHHGDNGMFSASNPARKVSISSSSLRSTESSLGYTAASFGRIPPWGARESTSLTFSISTFERGSLEGVR